MLDTAGAAPSCPHGINDVLAPPRGAPLTASLKTAISYSFLELNIGYNKAKISVISQNQTNQMTTPELDIKGQCKYFQNENGRHGNEQSQCGCKCYFYFLISTLTSVKLL